MTDRTAPVSLASLQGLAAGAVSGAILLRLEQSQTFNVFADVLNALFRVLGRFVSGETLVRMDTEPVAAALYVGAGAIAGASLGAVHGVARRSRGGEPGAGRPVLIALLLSLGFGAVLGTVWSHRG
ncbi:MAG: hypothetical protein HKN12_01365, partial [Gemmatimonadetes bacterium]|nr:hypothetical protein [Gemmatimonadota bacterium]